MSTLEIILSLTTVLGSIITAFFAYRKTKKKLEVEAKETYNNFVTSFNKDQEAFRKEVLANYNLLKEDYLKLHTTNAVLEEKIKSLQENIEILKRENTSLQNSLMNTQNERDDLLKRVKSLEEEKNRLNNNIIHLEKELHKLNGIK